jgi:hypothetical protein
MYFTTDTGNLVPVKMVLQSQYPNVDFDDRGDAIAGTPSPDNETSAIPENTFGDVYKKYGNEDIAFGQGILANAGNVAAQGLPQEMGILRNILSYPADIANGLLMLGSGGAQKGLAALAELTPGSTGSEDRLAKDLNAMLENPMFGGTTRSRCNEDASQASHKRIFRIMAITTYTELKTAIANWLNRDDLTSIIPDFISLVEADMDRKVRHWRMEERSTADIDARYTQLPSGFMEAVRFHLDVDERPIELVTPLSLQTYRRNNADTTGRPQYYSIIAGQIEVWPTPDTAYTGELYYYARTAGLSDSNTSNWILQYFPDAYLYGALTHSAPYLVDDQRTQVWASLYQNAIDGINANNEKAKFGGSGLRMQVNTF